MTTPTTVNDIFEMAKGMERVGKDFYDALALGSDNMQVREFCLRTARDEANHFATFTRMQNQWVKASPSTFVDPDASDELTDMAKERIQPDPRTVQKVAMGGNLRDALSMAMRMEQDAIDFYQGMAKQLPGWATILESIVTEERHHLANLRAMAG